MERRALDAAARVLADHGHGALTVDAVAARTGIAKTTLYRRWPTRAHLLATVAHAALAPPSTGATDDLAADLRGALGTLATALGRASHAGLLAEVVAASAHHPDLRAALHALGEVRRAATRDRLARAVADGRLAPGTDVELVLDQLLGPVYLHVLVVGDTPTPDYVRRLVDAVLAGAGHPGGARSGRGGSGRGDVGHEDSGRGSSGRGLHSDGPAGTPPADTTSEGSP
ncbi:TetR/AcrR family transcriptional regulator [Cellulomonas cellasea]|uniref:TetR/AcrR family transcriptional regulator n=1 Tax=Cellulomonas cellasea TaxID=43670 RepID=UPI001476E14C|nr:TetR/AcrR family transcriptional regulator [Cellulomonas cellasea]